MPFPVASTAASLCRMRVRYLPVLLTSAIVGFGPVSITGLIGINVVVRRPAWFGKVVDELYAGSAPDAFETSGKRQPSAAARIRCFVALTLLMVLDVAPVPVIGSIGLYVVITRPGWFRHLVRSIYRGSGAERTQLSEAP